MTLTLSHIKKTFNGFTALDDVTLTAPQNQTTVILGPSGSGKSTLLRCANLLEKPDSGTLTIDEESIGFPARLSAGQIRKIRALSSMVFQSFNLFPNLSVIDNITLGPVRVNGQSKQEAQDAAKSLLDKVGLADKADAYPLQLSGGQQQRVAIARALAMNPRYLLFDEPTSALDPELEHEVTKVMAALSAEDASLVVVTHNLRFARKTADKIVFLEHGNIRFDGPADAFFDSDDPRIRQFLSIYDD
ncbi:ABC transporter-like protein [Bifidobacterium goeldii]|uniref:ABC transporter-like protein n=1 Tax=Bifidobacterium goeldii TaxID=2306975 RepID=A0A430FLV2_9BIFI|nr:amino acid ABC transporter ATP-binding protein [Bifidobacterium goeldii]RSX53846.1 ABC transporter-like protein [Bifidobacterium goeldii]